MKHSFILSIIFLLLCFDCSSQDEGERITGFYFGPKAGFTLGNQNWNGLERGVMLNWHGAFFIESFDPFYKGSLFAQIGFHSRGSGLRLVNLTQGINFRQAIIWKNIALTVGAKKRLVTSSLNTPYYFIGLRAEYSISNNTLDVQTRFSPGAASLFYPFPEYSRKFVYGLSFGGGYEFFGTEYVQPSVEASISPDLSFQYASPEIPNVINPYNGQPTILQERNIRNITFEISVLVKFKREVILLDR